MTEYNSQDLAKKAYALWAHKSLSSEVDDRLRIIVNRDIRHPITLQVSRTIRSDTRIQLLYQGFPMFTFNKLGTGAFRIVKFRTKSVRWIKALENFYNEMGPWEQ